VALPPHDGIGGPRSAETFSMASSARRSLRKAGTLLAPLR
jgi:hypothetical protein